MAHETLQVLRLLESANRLDVPEAVWMQGILEHARPLLDRGLGLSGYFIDASTPDGFWAWGFDCIAMDRAAETERFQQWCEFAPVTLKRHAHLHGAAAFASQLPPGNIAREAYEQSFEITGHADVLGISALDSTAIGCAIAIPCPTREARGPSAATRTVWERTAAHLSSALRLRRCTRSDVEVVISPSGKIAHAEHGATAPGTLDRLRAAATRFDRARCTSAALDPLETTELWQSLVAGRWTLVDQFDRDGRRYIVARANEPAVGATLRLSAREAQVARAAALGHSNKLIAYELGISPSTVSLCLSRAARKLGARNRHDLIRLCAAGFALALQAPRARDEN